MSKKAKAMHIIEQHIQLLQCPVCEEAVTMMNDARLACPNRHSFDVAKQGYVNMLTHPVKSHYGKHLFTARQQLMTETTLFHPVHATIVTAIERHYNGKEAGTIADLGCGEGSHLIEIAAHMPNAMTNIGVDIAKEGIMTATRHQHPAIWLVGDLAKTPLKNKSADVILNLLSPANYTEFKRIAKRDALIIKLVPGPFYLKELRDYLQKPNDVTTKPGDLFNSQLHLLEKIPLHYNQMLTTDELHLLLQMTPLAWNIDRKEAVQYLAQSGGGITIDLELLIGKC